jgi:hypothetical protein
MRSEELLKPINFDGRDDWEEFRVRPDGVHSIDVEKFGGWRTR